MVSYVFLSLRVSVLYIYPVCMHREEVRNATDFMQVCSVVGDRPICIKSDLRQIIICRLAASFSNNLRELPCFNIRCCGGGGGGGGKP